MFLTKYPCVHTSFVDGLRSATIGSMNKYLFIGVVAILVIAGGWWYFNKFPVRNVIESSVEQNTDEGSTAISQPKPTNASDVLNWKTYTNTEFGFSIQHPPILNPFVSVRGEDSLISDSQAVISFVMDAVMIIVDTGSTLEQVTQVEAKIFAIYGVETGEATIGGIEGRYVYAKNHPDGPAYVYVVQNGNRVYRLSIIEKHIGNATDREKFVKSFRFTQ